MLIFAHFMQILCRRPKLYHCLYTKLPQDNLMQVLCSFYVDLCKLCVFEIYMQFMHLAFCWCRRPPSWRATGSQARVPQGTYPNFKFKFQFGLVLVSPARWVSLALLAAMQTAVGRPGPARLTPTGIGDSKIPAMFWHAMAACQT
jgi:hypothetical protein